MINAQFRLNYHTVVIKQFEKFVQPFQRLWVWAKPTNTFRLCNLIKTKRADSCESAQLFKKVL